MNIKKDNNENENIIACVFEDSSDQKVKGLEDHQTKNVYLNTFYFTVLSIVFGIIYFFYIG